MIRVQFVKPAAPYNAGEVAAFADDHAARLIAQGVAVAAGDAAEAPEGAADAAPAPRRGKAGG